MTNYENDIMNLLEGDTPKQKYEYLKQVLQRNDKVLYCIKYHARYGIPIQNTEIMWAKNKKEALQMFWKDKEADNYDIDSVGLFNNK